MKKVTISAMILAAVALLTSCYKNYYDISQSTLSSINNVSFRNDVVPIITSGACGCHNNGSTRQVVFSHGDTIFYSAIQSRAQVYYDMANRTIDHPGEGSIYFTPSQAAIIKKWYEQGRKDDYVPPPVTGSVSYASQIVPLYKTDCKGGSCHGGAAISLDYTALKNNEGTLTTMMNTGGSSGHPGGTIAIAPVTSATFLAWIAQGMKP